MNEPKCKTCNDGICKCLNKPVDEMVKADCQSFSSDNLLMINNDIGVWVKAKINETNSEICQVIKTIEVYDKNTKKKIIAKILPKYDEYICYKILRFLTTKENTLFIRSTVEKLDVLNKTYQFLNKIPDVFQTKEIQQIKVYAPYVYCKTCYKCKRCGNKMEDKKTCPKCHSKEITELRFDRTYITCPVCNKKLIRNKKYTNYQFKLIIRDRLKAKNILES